jgi:hypothetical protein
MARPSDFLVLAAALSLAACGAPGPPVTFALITGGASSPFSSVHGSAQLSGSDRVLSLCGERSGAMATDAGGSVCLELRFDAQAVSSLPLPATLIVSGVAALGSAPTFTPSATTAPALRGAVLRFTCACAQPGSETFEGTLTLRSVEARRLTGSVDLAVLRDDEVVPRIVTATFDVTGG